MAHAIGLGAPAPEGSEAAAHLMRLREGLSGLDCGQLHLWGGRLGTMLRGGGRLLVAGNGGSAAQAQHLSAELVGRYEGERQPLSALALHCDTSALTAVGNDYGYEEVFARQVTAHGRTGDVLLLLSVSGRSANLLRAVTAARAAGLVTWALTGPAPNPLASACDEAISVTAASTAAVQECHLVAVHLLCAAVDAGMAPELPGRPEPVAAVASRHPAPVSAVRRTSVVVVGDCLLDRDLTGTADRLSPEAPVPVVGDLVSTSRPGGAGLAALLAAAHGHRVTLVTALAADEAGDELRQLLDAAGVEVVELALTGATPVKVRVRAADRTVLMLDQAEPATSVPERLSRQARVALQGAQAVLVSDYGRGLSAMSDLRNALAAISAATPVVWDPHARGSVPVPEVRLVTPNRAEALRVTGSAVRGHGLSADIELACALFDHWPVPAVAMTRGIAGAVLVERGSAIPLVIGCEPVRAADSVGAGDAFAAAAAGLLAQGAVPSEAAAGAVASASAYVSRGGAAALKAGLSGTSGSGTGAPDAIALARRMRAAHQVVVVAGGCFDLLHTGHVYLLEEARRMGDCLIVCLNSDASVARLKGPGRPVVSASDRAKMLLALKAVDAVLVFDQDTPEFALRQLTPDIFVKGGDYSADQLLEAGVLPNWGGRVVLVPYQAGRSTTTLIKEAVRAES